MNNKISDFLHFIDRSPTSWHAARQIADRLTEANFIPLNEKDRWMLDKGKSYFVIRDNAAVCAFRLCREIMQRNTILASHLDSPGLMLKPAFESVSPRLSQFSTEIYGSPLLHTWFDRDLVLAGRVIMEIEGQIESRLVFLDDVPMMIPSLALHLDRSVADKGLIVHPQEQLNPIASIIDSTHSATTLESLLRRQLTFDRLIALDLFLVPLQKASIFGTHSEFISSARLDNLSSAYACLDALVSAPASKHTLQMAIFWNHEEVGSKTDLGAESFFINRIIDRICWQQKIDREDQCRIQSSSYCLSVDLAHGFHPNFPDRYDTSNAAHLGSGVVLKTNAMQRYATSASSAAPLIELCQKIELPLQMMAFRSDIRSGSTVGSIMAAINGCTTVDIGIAGWAMHSIRETIASSDQLALCELLKAVLETDTGAL
jgi:aspartyl aminopeptidase